MTYQPSLSSPSAHSVAERIDAVVGERATRVPSLPAEVCYEVEPARLLEVATLLRDSPELRFAQLMDLCGVDYLGYGTDEWKTISATGSGFSRGVQLGEVRLPVGGRRFAVVYNLLSIVHNARVRLRVPCEDAEDPILDSVVGIWPSANWFEREAFDLFGILFRGHPDLRRILTDYGFIGHPFRKDFPLIGNVEVRYDPEKQRVVYEAVSIEPRVLVPKVIRHDARYEPTLKTAKPAGN
jgi:NADH-quinone oxidoreductase subunit C